MIHFSMIFIHLITKEQKIKNDKDNRILKFKPQEKIVNYAVVIKIGTRTVFLEEYNKGLG